MRRIETEAGVLVGSVDRVLRRVVWHLECPDCQTLIRFTNDTFHGRAPLVCACGWKTRPIGHKERSEDGTVYAYQNYNDLAWGSGVTNSGHEGSIHSGMRL